MMSFPLGLRCLRTRALRFPATRSILTAARTNSTVAATTEPTKIPPRQVNVDRELPDPFAAKKLNRKYMWVYAIGVTVACALIFNYEKTGSPIVNSVMYCLRRSDLARENLGANIGFQSAWPWIWGTLNAVKGEIDIEYRVKGETACGTLRLKASRESKLVPFDVKHFELVMDDGRVLNLRNDPSIDFDF